MEETTGGAKGRVAPGKHSSSLRGLENATRRVWRERSGRGSMVGRGLQALLMAWRN